MGDRHRAVRTAPGADADTHRESDVRVIGRQLDTHLVEHQHDIVHGVGRLDRDQGDIRQPDDQQHHHDDQLFTAVHGRRRQHLAHRAGNGQLHAATTTDTDSGPERKPGRHFGWSERHAHLVFDQCNLLHGIGSLDWDEADARQSIDRCIEQHRDLLAQLHRRGWFRE